MATGGVFRILTLQGLQSCSTALLNDERGLLGRRGEPRAVPVPGLPAEKIGAHTRTTGFRKCFLSENENAAARELTSVQEARRR